MSPSIHLIAAIATPSRLIGDRGQLPWHLPEDLQRFRQLTTGHTIVMGRRTWLENLGGRALPQRCNLVLTRSPQTYAPHPTVQTGAVTLCSSLPTALTQTQDAERIFLIGGVSLYAEGLAIADELHLTLVEGTHSGDTYFPPYEHLLNSHFQLEHWNPQPGYSFAHYRRVR